MRFLLIFAFMVLAQNNNGTESCNVVKKELQHYPEGMCICKIKRYFDLFFNPFSVPRYVPGGTGQAVKILSRPVPWQDFERVPLRECSSLRSNAL